MGQRQTSFKQPLPHSSLTPPILQAYGKQQEYIYASSRENWMKNKRVHSNSLHHWPVRRVLLRDKLFRPMTTQCRFFPRDPRRPRLMRTWLVVKEWDSAYVLLLGPFAELFS